MTAVANTFVDKGFLLSNIPFLERNDPTAFSTTFQEHFQPVPSERVAPVAVRPPAQVQHKDLRHIKEYTTEGMASYQPHPLPEIIRTPCWSKLYTNFEMQKDPGNVDFLTTQSQSFRPHLFQPPTSSIRPSAANKMIEQVEKLPESTYLASFAPQQCSPIKKATVKHLAEGFPTLKRDGRHHHSHVSHYNEAFQGAQSRPAQPVKKRCSVALGDPKKIVERETTHVASFSWPPVCRPTVLKERLNLNLGNYSKDTWSTTARDSFYCHKLENPVALPRRNRNFSSIHTCDTDAGRNKERMSVTTSKDAFSNVRDLNHAAFPEHVNGADLMTKSNVEFSSPLLSGLYYTTTATEHYCKKEGERASATARLPSNILRGPEPGRKDSTTKTDFLPQKALRATPCLSQQRSNIRFPLSHQNFSTSHSDDYTAKAVMLQRPGCSQFTHHFVLQ